MRERNERHLSPAIPVVCTQYANRNGLLASLYAPCCILDYASQVLLDGIDRKQLSILIVSFNRVGPIVDHDKNFSRIRYMGWGLRAQRIAMGLRNATGIEKFCNGLLKP